MKTDILEIQGMMCDACAGHVSRALRGLNGVESAQVSLADKQAEVTYDPAKVQVARMVEAIDEDGYEAALQTEGDE